MTLAVVVDYGVGNLFSMTNALRKTGLEVTVTPDPAELSRADAVILPGVGNFGPAAEKIAPFKQAVRDSVDSGVPFLGSCLGLQLMMDWSMESPGEGLGLFPGGLKLFNQSLKVPHMGWNTVNRLRDDPLLDGVPDGSYFYFVHSYYPSPSEEGDALAVTDYGVVFPSILGRGCVYGCQFHPEKSGKPGAALLLNFKELVKR